ncbi:hypothetical protein V7O66_11585 [Methanolobus sp. ZRKC3]|uniref:hypothetical protein n=1 Tax=Methanolobus sp. ZRKC3 TaxID=3125786 RepID=UPI00324FB677
MDKRWIFLILIIAGIMVCGCAEKTADTVESIEEETDTAPAITGEEYGIRMEWYGVMKPSELEINEGDVIVWRNYKETGFYNLISDDELFEEQEMKFGTMFNHTFQKSGTYTFSVKDKPEMVLTVNVM